jgi:hypothetical protein
MLCRDVAFGLGHLRGESIALIRATGSESLTPLIHGHPS